MANVIYTSFESPASDRKRFRVSKLSIMRSTFNKYLGGTSIEPLLIYRTAVVTHPPCCSHSLPRTHRVWVGLLLVTLLANALCISLMVRVNEVVDDEVAGVLFTIATVTSGSLIAYLKVKEYD